MHNLKAVSCAHIVCLNELDTHLQPLHIVLVHAMQYVGHCRQAELPGDWFTADLGGARLVVARQADGSLRAFHNVSPISDQR